MPQNKQKKECTVLVTRFSAFGDVAMTIPVLYSACRCYPDVRFVMVTRPAMTSMFVNPPANLILAGFDLKNEYAGVPGIRRMAAEIVDRFHPDVFVDLHYVLRTRIMGLMFRLRGIPVHHIDKPRAARKKLTRHAGDCVPVPSQRTLFRETFARAGFEVADRFQGLFDGHDTAPASLYEAITAPKAKGEKWIGIAPFAAHPGKIYPVDKMAEVVAIITEKCPDARVFLFGGGDSERRTLEEWAARNAACTSLAGKKYGFAAELALMNHLDVMLSMDSANMHLAAIAGTRVLSVWGATHPACGFTPWRGHDDDFIQIPLPCRPCSVFGNKPCRFGTLECLNAISPQTVAGAILKNL